MIVDNVPFLLLENKKSEEIDEEVWQDAKICRFWLFHTFDMTDIIPGIVDSMSTDFEQLMQIV